MVEAGGPQFREGGVNEKIRVQVKDFHEKNEEGEYVSHAREGGANAKVQPR